jgi:hypothetical protein
MRSEACFVVSNMQHPTCKSTRSAPAVVQVLVRDCQISQILMLLGRQFRGYDHLLFLH